MSKGVRLHKEFGLNPTISVCIICGEEKNEIALLGAAYKGQAPMHMITGIEPCEKCRKKYLEEGDGVMLVEADRDKKPTGMVMVIRREAFQRIFNRPVPIHRIALAQRIVPLDNEAYCELQE